MPAKRNKFDKLLSKASSALSGLEKEASMLETLHQDVRAALLRIYREDPAMKGVIKKAYGYAVFPSVGEAALLVSGAFGKGEVFQQKSLIGYAGLVQVTVGVELGGQTFTEIIAFQDKAALERFKAGNVHFTAKTGAVLIKVGAAASASYEDGAMVLILPAGGMILGAGIGGQKFIFKSAALGRLQRAP